MFSEVRSKMVNHVSANRVANTVLVLGFCWLDDVYAMCIIQLFLLNVP